jgi:imidazolonepropionase-like amidohydrolase
MREGVSVLRPAAVYLGNGALARDVVVVIDGERIAAVGPEAAHIAAGAAVTAIDLPGLTLLPGLIDLHTHLLLHPYDRVTWEDQVLREPLALRIARATVAARATLEAGFLTVRDCGTEGAGYADAGLRDAIARGIVPGPRVLATTRAIVATGSYAPSGFAPECCIPQGAEEADGDGLARVVRDQIRRGADWIKVYADTRWGPGGETRPTFTLAELQLIVDVAESSGRHVVCHANSPEGMRRATLAGARTIEHGNAGTDETFALMAERGVALVPTLAAYDAIVRYHGWDGAEPAPPLLAGKRASLHAAFRSGVTIANGSDIGVFAHGENARELALLVGAGMPGAQALDAATSVAAGVLDRAHELGSIRAGSVADLIGVRGDPLVAIDALRAVEFVMQAGAVVERGEAARSRKTPV